MQTGQRVQWSLVTSFPRSLDLLFGPATRLSERVAALTDDRFRIRVHQPGEIVPALEVLGAVQRGTVQMGHSASYYYKGMHPALVFDCTVPFGLTSRQHTAWLLHGGGMELMRSLFAEFDLVNLPGGNTGAQMGGWFRRPITDLASLRGLSMRIPGLGGDVMQRMGVNPQNIAGGELYTALERGVVDAAEWVGPYDDERMGLNRVARHYYAPGWWEPGPALTFYIHRPAWEALPAAYQQALEAAAAESSLHMQAAYDAQNPAALARLIDGGTDVRRFPQDVMQAARGHARDVLEELASENPRFREIYTAWSQFRDASHRWFAVAEQSYEAVVYPTDALPG